MIAVICSNDVPKFGLNDLELADKVLDHLRAEETNPNICWHIHEVPNLWFEDDYKDYLPGGDFCDRA